MNTVSREGKDDEGRSDCSESEVEVHMAKSGCSKEGGRGRDG